MGTSRQAGLVPDLIMQQPHHVVLRIIGIGMAKPPYLEMGVTSPSPRSLIARPPSKGRETSSIQTRGGATRSRQAERGPAHLVPAGYQRDNGLMRRVQERPTRRGPLDGRTRAAYSSRGSVC
jgi:hypothetical protein